MSETDVIFVHLSDVVEAFRLAVKQERVFDGRSYVIASGQGHSLVEAFDMLAQEAFRQTGRGVEIRHLPEPSDFHPIERRNFVGNSGLFQRLTGWRPQIDLRAGIHDYFIRAASVPALAVGR